MSEIKILVTGNTIGPNDVSPFSISQYDFNSVITNPSVFLWSDKIILTPYINELIESNSYPDDGGKISKSLNKIFDVAKEPDLIEIKSPKNIITEKVSENISQQVEFEREYLLKNFLNLFEHLLMPRMDKLLLKISITVIPRYGQFIRIYF
jgi:hypothetical protein